MYPGGLELPVSYTENGSYSLEGIPCNQDIENVPEDRFTWVNLYSGGGVWQSKEEADCHASEGRIGRVKIKLEERWDE
jgi:hypothetical protein